MLTTASMTIRPDFHTNRLLQLLTGIYVTVWTGTAISPVDRFDWFLENLLVFAAVAIFAATYRRFPFSDLSYIMITIFLCLHAIGAHYTYSEAPAGYWLKEAFDLDRNHFDRIVHFLFGVLFGYPLREVVFRHAGVSTLIGYWFTFTMILTFSSGYEMVEWIVAEIVDPEAAYAYLGTQGDVFDAQKDTGLATIGVSICLAVTAFLAKRCRTRQAG